MVNFRVISIITSVIAGVLCSWLLFAPEIIFMLFNIDGHASAFFIGRRAAALFLGISVFTWVGRSAAHSEFRQAVCLGLTISMASLALLGIAEYLRGFAGTGIFLAVVTESLLALMYFNIWVTHAKK